MRERKNKLGYFYEKFKAGLLVFLIILCIVQVGILWSSQSGSFPFLSVFFTDSKNSSQGSIEDLKGNYLLPYKVVLSTGYDSDHYVISNGSKAYKILWDGAKFYLSKLLDSKPRQAQPFSEETWGSLVANKPYLYEFKTEVPLEIVKWALNISTGSTGEGLQGIDRFIISPNDSDNNNLDTVYIKADNNIYTYVLSDINTEALGRETFKSIYTELQGNENSKNYKIAIEGGRKTVLPLNMIAPLSSDSQDEYADVICIPLSIRGINSGLTENDEISEYDSMQKELFGEIRNDLYPDEDVYGSMVLKNKNNVYRLYKNSVFEYKYTGEQNTSEKAKLLDCYKTAISFILEQSSQNGFMKDINIYLSEIEQADNTYIFKFDFSIAMGGERGEVPVLLKNYDYVDNKPLDTALTVEATSKRVINCRWLAQKVRLNKEFTSYNWNFPTMNDKVYNSHPELSKSKLPLKDYGIYYILSSPKSTEYTIAPSFVLFNKEGSYSVPLDK